jgi:hypothetical protein
VVLNGIAAIRGVGDFRAVAVGKKRAELAKNCTKGRENALKIERRQFDDALRNGYHGNVAFSHARSSRTSAVDVSRPLHDFQGLPP